MAGSYHYDPTSKKSGEPSSNPQDSVWALQPMLPLTQTILATATVEYLTCQQHRIRLNPRIIPSLKETTEPLGGRLRNVLNSSVSWEHLLVLPDLFLTKQVYAEIII